MFDIPKRQQLILLVVAAVVVFGGGYRYALWEGSRAAESKPTFEQVSPSDGLNAKEIVVHVTGAVEKPGVYHLSPGARVEDAVTKATARSDADLDQLNLAAPLADGQKLVVPVKQTAPTGGIATTQGNIPGAAAVPAGRSNPFVPSPGAVSSGTGQLVNINTADQKELESLPGIGPSLAQRIIQYRETNGPFKTPEDLKNVSGVGEKRFEQLKDRISVYS